MRWAELMRAIDEQLRSAFAAELQQGMFIAPCAWGTTPQVDAIYCYPMHTDLPSPDLNDTKTAIQLDLWSVETREHDVLAAYDRHDALQVKVLNALKQLNGGPMLLEFEQWRFASDFAPTYMSRLQFNAAVSTACFDNNN
ncbi:hypothetical protein [Thiolinea disciformis]|uniref:hypothetical protein n=1 Tax=Thiolinea disciformis TaxID=125614 RepID=UPI00037002B9|nr:hypothetical protein [Thiolinea disciformis]